MKKPTRRWKYKESIMNKILQAKNLVQLLEATSEVIKKTIDADQVSFWFMNKESIATYEEDGGKLFYKFHSFFSFHVAIPPGLSP